MFRNFPDELDYFNECLKVLSNRASDEHHLYLKRKTRGNVAHQFFLRSSGGHTQDLWRGSQKSNAVTSIVRNIAVQHSNTKNALTIVPLEKVWFTAASMLKYFFPGAGGSVVHASE